MYTTITDIQIINFTDTEVLYTKATQNVFDQFGVVYTWEVKSTLMGLQREEVAKRITEIYNLPITWQEYLEQSHAECVRLMINSPLLPGEFTFYYIINIFFSFSLFF